ncbi:Fc.00g022340.m01.CDS01 [Cosmosporella sp. VM-42]
MIVTYKNNRLVPAVIIATCIALFYYLVDPSFEKVVPNLATDESSLEQYLQTPALNNHVDSDPSSPLEHSKMTKKPQHAATELSGNDVLLIMKTGGTTMWKRLLVHLTTSLASERIPQENIVIYSDNSETIGDFTIIDVLANMTEKAKGMQDFDVYRSQPQYAANNRYPEAAGVNGDVWGPEGGWIIDKYKFVPLMQHAGNNWPRAKWYIYMEDDTYLFLPNVLKYLSSFDWRKPHYLGSFAGKSDVIFAHGGAGFAVSRGAWESSFGRNPHMTEDLYEYTADHCCGDQVLGHALKKYGVDFGENGGDGKFTWGFNAVVHWAFEFNKYNWCSPLMSWHHVHNRDVAQYYELEKSWDFKSPMLHRDFFAKMILPGIQNRMEWWDNLANLYQVNSGNKDAPPSPAGTYNSDLWKKAWGSADACEAACKAWLDCIQWSYVEDLCKMDDKMIMGQGYAATMSERKTSLRHTSGWLPERLENWTCS